MAADRQQAYEALWDAARDPKVPGHIDYPEISLTEMLKQSCNNWARHYALDFFGQRTTFAELDYAIDAVASNLHAMGVGPGDHVALLMPTCPQHVIAFYAVLACGATVVEHNPLYTSSELSPMFADHHAEVAIVWDAAAGVIQSLAPEIRPKHIVTINMVAAMPRLKRVLLSLPIAKARTSRAQLSTPAAATIQFADLLKPTTPIPSNVAPSKDDIALVLYTSGTTGAPKGVPLTHANLVASTIHAHKWVTQLKPGEDVFLACLPLFHVFGCSLSMNAALNIGGMVHLIPKPETGLILDAIKRKTPTMVIAVPPLFERILEGAAERKVSLQGITTGISGAMSLHGELIDRWEKATGGLLIEGYGLSECSPIVCGNPTNMSRKADSIGIPFPDTQLRLADVDDPTKLAELGAAGEIQVKGPQVFGGYRNNPEANQEAFIDGWFRTGDVAEPDEDGFLHIVDRIKEVVITGGFNVYPSEVEREMRDHTGIEEIAVVGLANELGVEEVVAAVVAPDSMPPIDLEEFRREMKKRLAAYKVPRRVFVVDSLPRNAMGKVQRRQVKGKIESMAIGEWLDKMDGWRAWLDGVDFDFRDWLEQVGPDLRERLEQTTPELRERLERWDFEIRARLDEMPSLRERVARWDIGSRLDMVRQLLVQQGLIKAAGSQDSTAESAGDAEESASRSAASESSDVPPTAGEAATEPTAN